MLQRKRVVRPERVHVPGDVAVGGEHIQPAVVVEVEPSGPEAGIGEAGQTDERLHALLLEQPGAVVDVQGAALADELGDEQVLVTVVVEVAGIDAHVRLGFPAGPQRRPPQGRLVGEGAVAPVDPQLVLLLIVGDEDVDPAVVVEVRRRHPERRPELVGDAGLRRRVDERAVAAIAIQPVRLGAIHLGGTIVRGAGPVEARDVGVQIETQVVADEEVEPAVAVVVEKRGRHPPPVGIVRAALFRHVRERPVAVVPEHPVPLESGQIEVDPAIVVDVAGRDAHAVPARVQPALGRHVRESQPGPVR